MIKSIYCSCVNYSKPTVDLFSKVNGVMRGNKVSVEDGTAGGGGTNIWTSKGMGVPSF